MSLARNQHLITDPPKDSGQYRVLFYNPHEHPPYRTTYAYRNFHAGRWDRPFYSYLGDGWELHSWFENERVGDDYVL